MPQDEEKELLAKAKKGSVDAMFELANLYSFEGKDADAKYWYKKANKCGHRIPNKARKDLNCHLVHLMDAVWGALLLFCLLFYFCRIMCDFA